MIRTIAVLCIIAITLSGATTLVKNGFRNQIDDVYEEPVWNCTQESLLLGRNEFVRYNLGNRSVSDGKKCSYFNGFNN